MHLRNIFLVLPIMRRWLRLYRSWLLISLISFIIVVLDRSNSIFTTKVAIDLDVDYVKILIANDYEVSLFVKINGPSLILSSSGNTNQIRLSQGEDIQGAYWLEQKKIDISFFDDSISGVIERLSFDEGSGIIFERTKNALYLTQEQGKARAIFSISKPFFLNHVDPINESQSLPVEKPEALGKTRATWEAAGAGSVDFFPDWENLKISNIYVQDIELSKESDTNLGFFECAINNGLIRLIEYNRVFDITEDECLVMGGVEGVFSLSTSGKGFQMRYVGNIGEISIGPKGFRRNLTPSNLDLILNQTFLSAVIAFCGPILIAFIISGFARGKS